MSASTMPNGAKRMSFAKVAAASVPKQSSSIPNVARPPSATAPVHEQRQNLSSLPPSLPTEIMHTADAAAPQALPNASVTTDMGQTLGATKGDLGGGMPASFHEGQGMPSLVVNGSGSTNMENSSKNSFIQTPSDDVSPRAESVSELGTKPPSLDGKSITSGATFALDEKESLRPDDSASVMAAAEDDDVSIRGSLVAGSRGSEMAARFHRLQLGDMPPRVLAAQIPFAHQIQGVGTPQSGASDKQPTSEPKLPLHGAVTASATLNANGFYSQNPDEKLLEAMKSQKDRVFLLKLEQQVISFVQDSKEPFMDLPPSNSFCRMLTHKLADYYHMTHSFEAVAGSVRIYRTPFCRIPPLLSTIEVAPAQSTSPPPAPAIQPRKIMRRGEGDFGSGSAGQSKTTSEDGSDGKDKGPLSKGQLTREEREEAYNRARERIFGTSEKPETSGAEGDDSNEVSRASSVSAKASNQSGRRKNGKQRRNDSEGWDSRFNYAPVALGSQNATWAPMMSSNSQQFYSVGGDQYGDQFPTSMYGNGIPNAFGAAQPYQQHMAAPGYPAYNPMPPQYPLQPTPQSVAPQQPPQQIQQQQQRYNNSNPAMSAPYGSPMQGMAMPWQSNYPSPAPPANFTPSPPSYGQSSPPTYQATQQGQPMRPTHSSSGLPYAYGQLPSHVNPKDPKSQHPIPGSYKSHAAPFNPKTTSFIPGPPGGNMGPAQGSGPGFYPGQGTSPYNSPPTSYNGFQQPAPLPQMPAVMPQQMYGNNNHSYGMVRQGSNNGNPYMVGPPHGPPHASPILAGGHGPGNHMHHAKPIGVLGGPAQTFSHLPNYGNPATLPQKPST